MRTQKITPPLDRTVGPHRTTARIIGALYLAGMVVGVGGSMLIQPVLTAPDPLPSIATNGALLAVGGILWLATVVGDAAHGVLMFPVLRAGSERLAVGYLAARILDAMLVAVMVLLIVMQIPVGAEYLQTAATETAHLEALSTVLTAANVYAYEFGMMALGVAGLILCSAFFRSRLIPRALSVWGLVGHATLLGGSVLEILGVHLGSIQVLPGGLWEIFIGFWLIMKGFTAAPFPTAATPVPAALASSRL